MRKTYLLIVLNFLFTSFFGQITTSVNPTIAQMQTLLQGNGVVVSGLTITCPAGAYASFGNAAPVFGGGLNSGLLLTTGDASNVSPSFFNNSVDNSAPGSVLGDNLDASGLGTHDACYIKFLITPSCNTLSVNYVFASEEYNTYVGSINDVFGFVLDGPNPLGPAYNQTNIALIPGTSLPVSINNVNNGNNPPAGPCMNCAYFIDAPPGIVYNGSTTVLTASTIVTPCQTYTMTVGIWDVSDGILDSGVFLDVNGLSCSNVPAITGSVNPTTICGPQTVTLTASGAAPSGTYTWSAPASGGLTTTSGTVVTANPAGSTTYSISYSDINTCPGFPIVVPVTLTLTAPPALPVSQSPAGSICSGQSVTLTANGGSGTYSWSPGNGLSTTTNSLTVSSPTSTTTYTVTKSQGACVSSSVITVNVISTPTAAITPSFSTICSGQSVGLTAASSTNGPYIWTANSGANPPGAANVTVTPSATTTYTVLSGTGTCTATAIATVSISATPSISITPSNPTVCPGSSVGLSSSGNAPFVWTASSGTNPPSAANVTVTPSSTTSYTVLSGSGTCTASAVTTVSVTPPLSITITPSISTICVGQSVGLSTTGAGPFTWSATSGTNPASAANVTVTPSSSTTYTVLSGTGTCTASSVATVSISTTPTISITPSNTTICPGSSVVLNSSGSAPFVWTASSGTNPPSSASVTVTPSSTTTYTVLSGSGTCTATTSSTITVTPPASITITPSLSTICVGQTVTLTASGAGPFVWTASNGTNPPAAGTVTVSPTSTTSYTVLSGTGTCTSTAIASISISTTPSISITPSSTVICNGQSTTLSVVGSSGPFLWNASSGTNPSPAVTVTVSPLTLTTYSVLSGTGTCTASAVATVSVVPVINIALTASSSTVCLTNTTTISAVAATGLTYTWQPVSAIQGATNTSSIIALPSTTATVIYTVTISNSICAATNTIQLLVRTPPIGNFKTLNNDTICTGGCVTFSSTTTGSSPISHKWYYQSGIGTSSVGATPEACYPSAGNFSVTLIVSNNCGIDTSVKANYITVFDFPVLIVKGDTTIKIGDQAEVYASGGLSYSWSPNVNGSIICSTCASTIVQPTLTTQYIVVASNSKYCRVQDTVTVIVDVNCGDFFIPNVFSPNGDGLNDVINVHGRCISTFNLQIYSRWGEKVFETSTQSDSWDGTFRGQKLDTGVFVYKADGVSIDGQSFNLKGNITLIR